MDLELTPEQTLLVDTVRRFVETEILPLELNLDPDADEIPAEDFERLTEKRPRPWAYLAWTFRLNLAARTLTLSQERCSPSRWRNIAPGCTSLLRRVWWCGLSTIIRGHRGSKEALPLPHARGKKKGFFGLSEPSGDQTQPEPFRPLPFKMATTGSSMAANSGSGR